jgi:hypothetical protein
MPSIPIPSLPPSGLFEIFEYFSQRGKRQRELEAQNAEFESRLNAAKTGAAELELQDLESTTPERREALRLSPRSILAEILQKDEITRGLKTDRQHKINLHPLELTAKNESILGTRANTNLTNAQAKGVRNEINLSRKFAPFKMLGELIPFFRTGGRGGSAGSEGMEGEMTGLSPDAQVIFNAAKAGNPVAIEMASKIVEQLPVTQQMKQVEDLKKLDEINNVPGETAGYGLNIQEKTKDKRNYIRLDPEGGWNQMIFIQRPDGTIGLPRTKNWEFDHPFVGLDEAYSTKFNNWLRENKVTGFKSKDEIIDWYRKFAAEKNQAEAQKKKQRDGEPTKKLYVPYDAKLPIDGHDPKRERIKIPKVNFFKQVEEVPIDPKVKAINEYVDALFSQVLENEKKEKAKKTPKKKQNSTKPSFRGNLDLPLPERDEKLPDTFEIK